MLPLFIDWLGSPLMLDSMLFYYADECTEPNVAFEIKDESCCASVREVACESCEKC